MRPAALALALLLAACDTVAPDPPRAGSRAVAAAWSLVPERVISRVGADVGPPGALIAADLDGAASDPGATVDLVPANGRYVGDVALRILDPARLGAATAVRLSVRTRGPDRGDQRWRWQVLDACTGGWVTVGANPADGGVWTDATFDVPLASACLADGRGRIRVRAKTAGDARLSVDRLALVVEAPADWWRPAPGTSWQWQLTGRIDTSVDVDMIDVDLFDTPAATIRGLQAEGRAVVCYVSAGSWEAWRPDADAYPESVLGEPLADWPGERWVDVRDLATLGPILGARLDLAARKGCDGVEPDNVDGWTHATGFPLSAADQLAFHRFVANAAHARGLSVGMKNDVGHVAELVGTFDWALNESCFVYDECELLLPFVAAGKAVFGTEYVGSPSTICPQANAWDFDTIKKRPALDAWRRACR